jgi:hypothetical protein
MCSVESIGELPNILLIIIQPRSSQKITLYEIAKSMLKLQLIFIFSTLTVSTRTTQCHFFK